MKSKLSWFALGLAAYLLCLIIYLPANQVLGRAPLPDNIQFSQVSGTLWQGSAGQVLINGVPIQQVNWQLSASSLLLGRAQLVLDAGNPRAADEVSLNGEISLKLTDVSQLQGQQLRAFIPTNMLVARLPLPVPVNAGGRLRVTVEQLDYQHGCQLLQGNGSWLNAQVAGISGPIAMGTIDATLGCQQQDIRVQIEQPNLLGLEVVGLLSPNQQLRINGKFKPDPSLPTEVHQAAKFFGRTDAQGYYSINY